MMQRLKERLISIPEINQLPIWVQDRIGLSRYYKSVQKAIDSESCADNYVYQIVVMKDIWDHDQFVVAYTDVFDSSED